MGDEDGGERVSLNESAQPKGDDTDVSTFSANPAGAIPATLEKSAQPKAPEGAGTDQASAQPVSALPDTESEPPPPHKG